MNAPKRGTALHEIHETFGALYRGTAGFLIVAVGAGPHLDENGKYAHRGWTETPFEFPCEADLAAREILRASSDSDVYIATSVMKGRRRTQNTAARNTVHADVDGGLDLNKVREIGAFAIASGSAGHGHVYCPVAENLNAAEFRALSRGAMTFFGAKDPKFCANDLLRPAGTFNFKPTVLGGEPAPVAWLVRPVGVRIDKNTLAERLGVDLTNAAAAPTSTNTAPVVMEPVELAGHPRIVAAVELVTTDRSIDTMRIVGACHRDRLNLAQARWVVNSRADLAKRLRRRRDDDVLRCWLVAVDPRQTSTTNHERGRSS